MVRAATFLVSFLVSISCLGQCPDTTFFFFYDSPQYGGFGYGPVHAVHLATQADVDSFSMRFPNCNEVNSLLIGDPSNDTDVTNLDGISQINKVTNNSILANTDVDSAFLRGSRITVVGNDSLRYLGIEQDGQRISEFYLYDSPLLKHLPDPVSSLDDIGGVTLVGNGLLQDLSGLDSIKTMLRFSSQGNHSLLNLSGLENLDSVRGSFDIIDNQSLSEFEGVTKLRTCARLLIRRNENLRSLSALSNLSEIRGDLDFFQNDSLRDLQGLESLSFIEDDVQIQSSHFHSLHGLQGLKYVGNNISLWSNYDLVTLDGLDNLDTVLGLFTIRDNPVLSTCHLNSVCALMSEGVQMDIADNAGQCQDGNRVFEACGLGSNCPYDFIAENQAEVDSFPIKYPSCTCVINNLQIDGTNNDIENLDSLSGISKIGGRVEIRNTLIKYLRGLDSLQHVRGNMMIRSNRYLPSLVGLESLDTIEGRLDVSFNRSLRSLQGLDSLRFTESIDVDGNDSLYTLSGLENLRSISSWVGIAGNDRLSICNTPTFCHLIPLASITFISNNSTPCETASEILNLCDCVSHREISTGNGRYEASSEIENLGNAVVTTIAEFNAPQIILNPNFEVESGATLLISSDGCDN